MYLLKQKKRKSWLRQHNYLLITDAAWPNQPDGIVVYGDEP